MYRYKGISFKSSWQLAYYIYCIDNNVELQSRLIYDKLCHGKVGQRDIRPYLLYVYYRYGKGYLSAFKDRKKSDFKRKIIEVPKDIKEIEKYKNKNVRFHYKCKQCSANVYTTWHLLEHFNDGLCKYCRTHKN